MKSERLDAVIPAVDAMTARRKVAYVGGALDSTTKILKGLFLQRRRPGDRYFQWTDRKSLAAWIDENASAVVVVGHSYGGHTAANVVAAGHRVHSLITIDPVGWTRPSFAAVAANAAIWINYDSIDTGLCWPNIVARVGGAWNSAPARHAHHHYELALDHVTICRHCVVELENPAG